MSASNARTLRIVGGALIVLGLLISFVPQHQQSLWTYRADKYFLVDRTGPKPAICSQPGFDPNGLNAPLGGCGDQVWESRNAGTPFSQDAIAENVTPLTVMIVCVVAGVVLLLIAAARGATAADKAPRPTKAAAARKAPAPVPAATPARQAASLERLHPATQAATAARTAPTAPAPPPNAAPHPMPEAAAPKPFGSGVEQQLLRLRELHDAGVLDDADFARAQRRAIDNAN